MDESKCFAGKRWSDVEVLLDCKRVVSLLSPKAIFILAWGNAPGIGVRFPGAMPLAMVIMAVGQSECPNPVAYAHRQGSVALRAKTKQPRAGKTYINPGTVPGFSLEDLERC